MSTQLSTKCIKCDEESVYNSPAYLCEAHWMEWWNEEMEEKDKPQLNSLVRFDYGTIPGIEQEEYPFKETDRFVYLGEIIQMPGRCVVARTDGKVFVSYRTNSFVVIPQEDC